MEYIPTTKSFWFNIKIPFEFDGSHVFLFIYLKHIREIKIIYIPIKKITPLLPEYFPKN